MRKAIGYIRVSTAGQVDEGVSLDAQREKIRQWCELHDTKLVDILSDEGMSGKRADNRPGLQRALERVCKAKGILVVWSLDRLARSTRDAIDIAERLEKSGADLAILTLSIDTSTAIGRFFFTLMAGLAQLERQQIGERTRAALAHKKAKGEVYGAVPLGFDRTDDARLIPNSDEQATVLLILSLRGQGWSYRRIAAHLNDGDFDTKGGGQWFASTVRYICTNQLHRSSE